MRAHLPPIRQTSSTKKRKGLQLVYTLITGLYVVFLHDQHITTLRVCQGFLKKIIDIQIKLVYTVCIKRSPNKRE